MEACFRSGAGFIVASVVLTTLACGPSGAPTTDNASPGATRGAAVRAPSSASTVAPPAATRSTDSDARAGNRGRPRIVVVGDSLTAGLGLSLDEAYPALLQQRVNAVGLHYEVINAGISGDTSAGGLARLDWALDGDVRILILALGGNDALRGLPPEQLKTNLATMIERAQARGIAVVLAGMEAPPNWGAVYTKEFHDVFPSLASKYRVSLVPFLLAGVAGIERLNQRDGIHPTAEGDRIVADTVWRVLEPVVVKQASPKEGASGP